MNKKTEAVARRAKHNSINVWSVAGMMVKAPTVYDALFVKDPYGHYRQCVVYSLLEDHWMSMSSEEQEEFDLSVDFEFHCEACHRFREPEHLDRLLDEITPLVGEIELVKTECQYVYCGKLCDVDDMFHTSCCDSLVCRECMTQDDMEKCTVCGTEINPVDALALLADS